MQHGQRRVIRELFKIFVEATQTNDPHGKWAVLPTRNRAELVKLREDYGDDIPKDARIRVAADAIAGMTDHQAMLMYHRLTGISYGSILDAIIV